MPICKPNCLFFLLFFLLTFVWVVFTSLFIVDLLKSRATNVPLSLAFVGDDHYHHTCSMSTVLARMM